jgi:hypothetical protein
MDILSPNPDPRTVGICDCGCCYIDNDEDKPTALEEYRCLHDLTAVFPAHLCKGCVAHYRNEDRKTLIAAMGVQQVCGRFWSWTRMPDFTRLIRIDDDAQLVLPSKREYIDRLKSKFIGNPEYDQQTVTEYVAKLESKLAKIVSGYNDPFRVTFTDPEGNQRISIIDVPTHVYDADAEDGDNGVAEDARALSVWLAEQVGVKDPGAIAFEPLGY